MDIINRPRGTADVLPRTAPVWQKLEATARRLCKHFHVQEVRTPVFEHTELFLRGVGETTDIVEKEVYEFQDRGGRSLTLRPEGTAPLARAVLENKLYAQSLPLKLYYIAPMFRYERPGAGRFRQHHQFGIEIVGTESPAADVEVMNLAMRFYEEIGAGGLTVLVNSVGCPCCRPQYREALLAYLRPRLQEMCDDCNRRAERNPLRILDCKQKACQEQLQGAPSIQDVLCEACSTHFAQVTQGLQALGIPFAVDAALVRGLDYYTRTVFEIVYGQEGAWTTVSAGGRYNGLYEQLGGPPLPAVGFGGGLERAIQLLEERGGSLAEWEPALDVYLIPVGEAGELASYSVGDTLRRAGLTVDRDFEGNGLKSGLKRAARRVARFAVILGEAEQQEEVLLVKELATGEQQRLSMEEFLYRMEQ